jgi:hypothetical protein
VRRYCPSEEANNLDWLHDSEGWARPGVPKPALATSKEVQIARHEWADGSAIVIAGGRWAYGVHRERLSSGNPAKLLSLHVGSEAERHVLAHQELDGMTWDWRDEGTSGRDWREERLDGRLDESTRYRFSDGSAILATDDAWDFTVHDDRLEQVTKLMQTVFSKDGDEDDDEDENDDCDPQGIWTDHCEYAALLLQFDDGTGVPP